MKNANNAFTVNMPPQSQPQGKNYEANLLVHEGNNPIHQARIEKAFALHAPKTKWHAPKQNAEPGNPWLAMMGEKK